MLITDAMLYMMSYPWYWTTGECLAFMAGYLSMQGDFFDFIGTLLKAIVKFFLIIVTVFVVITVVGLYIINCKLNPKAVATVTNVVNDDVMGGYYQKLTLEYTYNGKEYVVKDMDASNLLAEVGDKYVVSFYSFNPNELEYIQDDDKLPTPWQAFLSSIKYGIIGIIIFLIFARIVKSRL